jgi:serine/threonine-protein kinase
MPDPTVIGKYQIAAKIGRGGMGHVYRAIDPLLKREVALKTMLKDLSGDEELRTRFMREAQSAGGLRHPNIVTIYDLGEDEDKCPYIAMEFLTGTDIEHVIKNHTALSILKKLDIIIQTCQGLGYAHSKGIIHRDIKPANIRLLDNGEVKIMDFGIAKITASHFTRTGMIMGTPHYMSPEQIRGETVDGRSDIFSIGVVLYELLVYRKPFPGDNPTTVLFKIIHSEADPLADETFTPPEGLDEILGRALAKKPENRYANCDDMIGDLLRLFDQLKTSTGTETVAFEPKPYEAITVGRTPVPKRTTTIRTGFNVATPTSSGSKGTPVPQTAPPKARTIPPEESAPTVSTPIPAPPPPMRPAATNAENRNPVNAAIPAAPPVAVRPKPEPGRDLPPISPTPVPSMARKWALLATSGVMGIVIVVILLVSLARKFSTNEHPAQQPQTPSKISQSATKSPAPAPATTTRAPETTKPVQTPPLQPQPAAFTPMPGWLSLNVQPWAEIQQIKNENGDVVPLTQTLTPCKLQLAPGKYHLTLFNSQFQNRADLEVLIRSNETTSLNKKMEGFDYAKAVDSLGF